MAPNTLNESSLEVNHLPQSFCHSRVVVTLPTDPKDALEERNAATDAAMLALQYLAFSPPSIRWLDSVLPSLLRLARSKVDSERFATT